MTNTICLDENYSTTRLVTKEKPEIVNKPEDKFETVLFLPECEGRKGEGGLRAQGYFKNSYEDKPLISIITVVFNGEKALKSTIEAVFSMPNKNLEYIIIDGGSNDNSLNIIKNCENKIDYWLSEKDNGIYDAMNKGARVANGSYLLFANADDILQPSSGEEILEAMKLSFDVISMPVRFIETGYVWKSTKFIKKYRMPFPHPGLIVKKSIFSKLNGFDTRYKYSADYDFILKLLNKKPNIYFGNSVLSNFQLGGASSNNAALIENIKIRYRNNLNIVNQVLGLLHDFKRFIFNE